MIPQSLAEYTNRYKTFDSKQSQTFLFYRYLEKNYTMTFDSYCQGKVISKFGGTHFLMSDLMIDVEDVFSVNRLRAYRIVSTWWTDKELLIRKELTQEDNDDN